MAKKMVKLLAVTALATMLITLAGCGKKGPLKLEPQLLPTEVENLTISQEGLFGSS